VASQTHGYREFIRLAASTGKAIAELDGADLSAARAEALGHIRAYSRRDFSPVLVSEARVQPKANSS
jgi:hypothetical protein